MESDVGTKIGENTAGLLAWLTSVGKSSFFAIFLKVLIICETPLVKSRQEGVI